MTQKGKVQRPSERTPIDRDPNIGKLISAGEMALKSRKRFTARTYLQDVYRLYRRYRRNEEVQNGWRTIAECQGEAPTEKTHPLRTLLDLTSPYRDPKTISRFTRALEYAAHEKVPSKDLFWLLEHAGGISGCARAMARIDPKRRTRKSDWD